MSEQEKYIKGFNSGYLISKHEPSLGKKIVEGLQSETPYTNGFVRGTHEYEQERSTLELKELKELENMRNRGKNREQERDNG